MKKITLTHEIHCSQERFWEVFFDEGFNTSLFRDHLGFPKFEVLKLERHDDGRVERTVRGVPKMDVPKPLQKVLGDNFGYDEEGSFDPQSETWTWKMKPNTLAGKLRTEGTVRCEKISDDKCRRVAVIEMEAKVFGVGGLLESTTEKEMRQGWDKSASFMNDWLAKNDG